MKFIYNGVRYKSIPELAYYTCDGCAFSKKLDCHNIEQSDYCSNKHVIFVKTKKQPQNEYQYWEGNTIPPIEANTLVDVILRNGHKETELASNYRWNHAAKNSTIEFTSADIIAWRIHIEN